MRRAINFALSIVSVAVVIAVLAVTAGTGLRPAQASFVGVTSNDQNSLVSAAVGTPSIRVTTYQLSGNQYAGTNYYTINLVQDLSPDYFVMMVGATGDGTSGGDRVPITDLARVSADPFGNFARSTAAPNQLEIARTFTNFQWQGAITVVESLQDSGRSGFSLVDVHEVLVTTNTRSFTSTGAAWTDINQVGIYGGVYGGGVTSNSFDRRDYSSSWARIWPSGTNTVNYQRLRSGRAPLRASVRFTTFIVEWGNEWNIQRVQVTGNASGNGVNSVNEYNTAAINPVNRANTFITAAGTTNDSRLSRSWLANVWTLGDGVNMNAVENQVAVGSEGRSDRSVEVYVHTNANLNVQYAFGADGTTPSGISSRALDGYATIAGPLGPESYGGGGGLEWTTGYRFSIASNSSAQSNLEYPRPVVWSRITDAFRAGWSRSRSGAPGAIWYQVPDFAKVTGY
ncbi:MAG: hypothetical protein GXP36_11565 [Actinobacteria bacterium]|nr:hypothetical protein [Actinomycetota bacterium]